ncbi:MAG: hypothetical protein ABFD90_15975 [Phycisphaerales bacterium]
MRPTQHPSIGKREGTLEVRERGGFRASPAAKRFDAGEDVPAHLDVANARRPEQECKRINVD